MDRYLELKDQFEDNRDEENAIKMAAYMRNLFPFYGLPTPKRKAIYKELLKVEKRNKVIDWELLDKCYADDYRELQYFVMDYLVAMQKFLTNDMKSQGYGMILTSTQVDEEAQHFYRKLGYKDCGGFIIDVPEYEQPMEMFLIKGI